MTKSRQAFKGSEFVLLSILTLEVCRSKQLFYFITIHTTFILHPLMTVWLSDTIPMTFKLYYTLDNYFGWNTTQRRQVVNHVRTFSVQRDNILPSTLRNSSEPLLNLLDEVPLGFHLVILYLVDKSYFSHKII